MTVQLHRKRSPLVALVLNVCMVLRLPCGPLVLEEFRGSWRMHSHSGARFRWELAWVISLSLWAAEGRKGRRGPKRLVEP
jgi:hypothetical protein